MKRHDTDVSSLVFGLFFLGVFIVWSLVELDVMGLDGLEVAAPVLLVSIGLAGLMASIGKLRRDRSE
ncbi:hypothetical protein [Phytoactinopolyspora mesophila]|uniref:Uncharacterized protein n=1 Tax=Phytoactinopolyspora mesophila TaxID=2650750 RepID=A0A7K3M6M2_9ACTN|nr:hypothetical protein [Phytoactinopolyspora mesophila]NDL58542.1 hypothetical protein [Phytoactinopolyspora mesophila]